jgi:hypothetical protein
MAPEERKVRNGYSNGCEKAAEIDDNVLEQQETNYGCDKEAESAHTVSFWSLSNVYPQLSKRQ